MSTGTAATARLPPCRGGGASPSAAAGCRTRRSRSARPITGHRRKPMMNAFDALLEARDPALGRFRAYRLEAGPDLLGAWQVVITYGRIGTPGRCVRYSAADEAEARKLVHRS